MMSKRNRRARRGIGEPCRKALAIAGLLALLAAASSSSAESKLDGALARAGFSTLPDKALPAFSLRDLGGVTITEAFFADRPAIILVCSGGPPPALLSLAELPDGLGLLAFTTDPASDAATSWAEGPDFVTVCPGALKTIRAMGGFPPPSWIVVLPGGRMHALHAGRLDGDALMNLASALAANPIAAAPSSPAAETASFLPKLEQEIVDELNLARRDPAAYVEKLKAYRSEINGKRWERPGKITVVLNEGRAAVDEAIAALSKQPPLPQFSASEGLTRAAMDLVVDQGKNGKTGHTGSDGSDPASRVNRYGSWGKTMGENIAYGGETAEECVMQLIVDDGVPSRGHRKNIFNAQFLVIGVATGKHPGIRTVCVMDFAGGYEEGGR
jgi:uncharacterized protein YkwD